MSIPVRQKGAYPKKENPMNREMEVLRFLQEVTDTPPELPYEPTLFPMLFAVTREGSRSSTHDLAQLVRKSQKLASRVLAVANSSAYTTSAKVSSIERAVSVLGFNEVRSIVVMVSASYIVKKSPLPVRFDGLELWRHQILTAEIAKIIGTILTTLRAQQGMEQYSIVPDELYAAGLLHDIGKAILATYRPQVWADIFSMTKTQNLSFAEAEQQYWGLGHGTIAAQLLRIWQLPPLLTDAIEWHNFPYEAMAHKTEAKILSAASILAHNPPVADAPLPEAIVQLLPEGIDTYMVARLVRDTIERSPAAMLARIVMVSQPGYS